MMGGIASSVTIKALIKQSKANLYSRNAVLSAKGGLGFSLADNGFLDHWFSVHKSRVNFKKLQVLFYCVPTIFLLVQYQ